MNVDIDWNVSFFSYVDQMRRCRFLNISDKNENHETNQKRVFLKGLILLYFFFLNQRCRFQGKRTLLK